MREILTLFVDSFKLGIGHWKLRLLNAETEAIVQANHVQDESHFQQSLAEAE